MSQPETVLLRRIQLAASNIGVRLWRNNVGRCVYGETQHVEYGCGGPGAADLVGYVPVTVGGVTLPVFAAVEVKTPKGRLSGDQRRYLAGVANAGAVAVVARSVDDALVALRAVMAGDAGALGKVWGV